MTDAHKPVIVWDIDDVMNDLMASWFRWWRAHERPDCRVGFADLTENPPHERLGISCDRYLASLDAFRASEFAALPPRTDVLDWFRRNGARAHHIALTAVPQAFAERSAAWLFTHFGAWVRTFAFVPSPRLGPSAEGRHTSKAEYLRWFGHADLFVDDSAANVAAAREAGLAGVLVPRPWNSSTHSSFDSALADLSAFLETRTHAQDF